jgi:exodeoxyribonuclease VIII
METNRPKPGLHRGVDFRAYKAWPAVNNTLLGKYARVAADAKLYLEQGDGPATDAMILGGAIHCAILERKEMDRKYILAPSIDCRSKAGKEAWAEVEHRSQAEGREILTAGQWNLSTLIADAVLENPTVKRLLTGPGDNELAIAWHDKKTGELCKARLDRWARIDGLNTIIDIKTTRDASPIQFGKDIASHFYHRQAAFYLSGMEALKQKPHRFVFIAVEKAYPYLSACYVIEQQSLDEGTKLYQDAIATHRQCSQNQYWPGHSLDIEPIDIPSWALTQGNIPLTFGGVQLEME